jgi:hypothetical protein
MINIADAVAQVLRNDIISGTASGWVVAYPTMFSAGASSVPLWMYTCLKDIWAIGVEGGITTSQWQNEYVVSRFGLGESRPKTIDISCVRTIDQADWPAGLPQSNTIGAEANELHIYLKYPNAVPEVASEMLEQAELRIRRLIDYNVRVNTFGNKQFQPGDPFVGDTKAYWEGWISQDIKEVFIKYFVSCTRFMDRRPPDDPVQ